MSRVPVVEREDNRKAIVAAIMTLLTALFLLFFIKYHEPDPPKMTIPIPITMSDEGIENFEISSGGGGTPSPSESQEQVVAESAQEQPTQEESSVTVSAGSGSADDASSTADEPANPFSGSGTGGQGTAGSGGGFGSDDGPGPGSGDPGLGSGDRVRLTNVSSKPKTPNSQLVKIALKLTVDARGKVIGASVDRNNTTTTNQALIDEVIEIAKKEVTYKPREGARNQTLFYTVTVQPG